MRDLLFAYDKETFIRKEFGEIQKDFNFSFVIDGTKDSAKIEVINFVEHETEPYTIIKHETTNTWWIVSHDKVERYKNENNTFVYRHNLELLGAIELLNARDLTDSGFNQNRYTIETFIKRVINHSNFEFKDNSLNYLINLPIIRYNNAIDKDKIVDYVKTFENYTPLTALREFLGGYNCVIKLSFSERTIDNTTTLNGAIFDIYSKTGNTNKSVLNESAFNEVEEVGTMDKNSFGTTVISNAQNVISTKAKTYPSIGGLEFSSNAYTITPSNAVLKLPSDIYKVNWLKMSSNPKLVVGYSNSDDNSVDTYEQISFSQFDDVGIFLSFDQAIKWLNDLGGYVPEDVVPQFLNEKNNIINQMREYGIITLYNEENYDPVSKKFVSTHEQYVFDRTVAGDHRRITLNLTNKELSNNVETANSTIYWERGKSEIGGFGIFDSRVSSNDNHISLENGIPAKKIFSYLYNNGAINVYYKLFICNEVSSNIAQPIKRFNFNFVSFKVNYIPMADIKIKVDNSGVRKDSKLYNQNGKLTDSVALSKSLLSYSKEIESNTITKYASYYYSYNKNNGIVARNNNIPSVGDLVDIRNDLYVINNVSLTFYQNDIENLGTQLNYFVKCEFTLSKNIAIKSLMVNPNQNIRDYGIPQNFNVKRKQLYRDFYELDHSPIMPNAEYLLPLEKVLNLDYQHKSYQEHIAVIKLTYNSPYGGGTTLDGNEDDVNVSPKDTWYYQLESTTFIMKKSIYEVIDFKDNNIIGYGSQNVWCGWDITRVFKNMIDDVNVPISYVDNNGEFKDVDMYLSTKDQVSSAWESYINQEASIHSSDYDDWDRTGIYYVFIPQDVFENVKLNTKHDFRITELNYNKDATEVPIFEYSCQIDDSDDVLVGENIFSDKGEGTIYLYGYVLCDKNKYNENNYGLLTIPQVVENNGVFTLNNAVKFTYSTQEIDSVERQIIIADFYDSVTYDKTTNTITYGNSISIATLTGDDFATKDLLLVKHTITQEQKPNVVYSQKVIGSKSDGAINLDVRLSSSQTLVNATIQLDSGYKDDRAYHSERKEGNTIYYVIGGQTYDDTEATARLNITTEFAGSSGTVDVSGSENDGYMTTRVLLESGQTLTNVSATLGPQYKGDTIYTHIVSVSGKVITYRIGGNTYDDTTVSGELYCVVSQPYTQTQDLHTSVSGNRGHGNYYYDIFLPESGGQYITNANIIPDDPSSGADDNTYIVSSQRLDSSYWRITYRCGAFNSSAVVNAELWWRVNTPTTIDVELSTSVIGSKEDGNQVWTISPWGTGYSITDYGFRNMVLTNNYYQNASVSATIVSAVGGIIQYHFNCDTPELDMDAVITYTKSSYQKTQHIYVYGNKTQEKSYTFTLASNETFVSYSLDQLVLTNNNVLGSFATITNYTSGGVITYEMGQNILNEDVEATITYTISDSNDDIISDMLFIVKDMSNRNKDYSDKLKLFANYYRIS